MVKQSTADVEAVLGEIRRTVVVRAEDLGEREANVLRELEAWDDAISFGPFQCDLTRVSLPDRSSIEPFGEIVSRSPLPIVADIHFQASLALAALEKGCHKIRINPGNIGDSSLVREIARESRRRGVPIRVGVNAGSLEKDLLERYGPHSAEALAMSALRSVEMLESEGCRDLVISLKANSAKMTIEAYRIIAQRCDYPLHLGVTEAGFGRAAVVNSWAGIGALLQSGIGDTLRVSLTEDAVLEVVVGGLLLKYLGLG
jgi:(E)-4-hydroxy-3-methylbut-2-enyl-diphosphate synthase